ncbi:MAG: MerR family transcriptional regulator [Actinomadura sp.]
MTEFEDLFAEGLTGVERGPLRLRLTFDADAGREAVIRDLLAQEQRCCAFLGFSVERVDAGLVVEVTAPQDAGPALDGMQALAERKAPPEVVAHGMSGLRSGQVAGAAGVNPQTLRYYERRGLLAEPERSLGGHRRYPPETVTVLRVIKTAQRLGFTLDEVADLLDAARHRHDAGLRERARDKLVEVERRIADLQIIRSTLHEAINAGCDDLMACAAEPCCPLPFVSG